MDILTHWMKNGDRVGTKKVTEEKGLQLITVTL